MECESCMKEIKGKPRSVPESLWRDWQNGMGSPHCETCYRENEKQDEAN